MYQFRRTVGGVALTLLLSGVLAGPAVLEAQRTAPGPDGRWPLQPLSANNHILAPFMEGWYANEDGTYTISFGYSNSNLDTLYIPVGENNSIDPAQFSGMQPTVFLPGHHRGIFTVTLPAGNEGPGRLVDPYQSERRRHEGARPDQFPCVRIGLDAAAARRSASQRYLQFAVGRGPGTSGHHVRTHADRGGRISPHPLAQRDGPLGGGIRTMPVLRTSRFAWCGPSSRVPDRWRTRGTSPTRSLRWRSRILLGVLRLRLFDDVSPPDPRLSHFRRGMAPPA